MTISSVITSGYITTSGITSTTIRHHSVYNIYQNQHLNYYQKHSDKNTSHFHLQLAVIWQYNTKRKTKLKAIYYEENFFLQTPSKQVSW